MNSQIKKLLKDPARLFLTLGHREMFNWMNDKTYLKIIYRICMKKKLNLDNPKTFNEKLQWLKLYDRNPEYTNMVDKYEVKKYVADKIGEEYIIPTLGVWDKFEDIDFDKLPDQFVLKCTHDSGGLVICKDKSKLDIEKAGRKISNCLKHSFFWGMREWPYKDVKPRIIAEQYMVDESGYELKDYKFFCFDGKVKMLFISSDRADDGKETKTDFFDENFTHLPVTKKGKVNADVKPVCPKGFEKMKELAEILSQGIPHARIDFYNVSGKIYFGEITFFSGSGMVPFEPEEWDAKLGEYITLPTK